jgi:predicted O-methyltransferase YrrM
MEQEDEYLKICDEIKKLIEESGEPLEGNCMYRHLTLEPWDCLLSKRKNYQSIAKGRKMICEIGFNAGHSLLAMMLVNPTARYVLFDLGVHKYAKPCFEYLKKEFPDTQMEIMWGDSRHTIPTYHHENPHILFDVIHIDGGHKQEVYVVDWENSLNITSSGSILIFDDTDNKKISAFIDKEIEKGIVHEPDGFLETFGYQHRILVKN